MVPYPEGALDESGRVRCGGDAIGFWERTVAGKQGEGVARGGSGEESARVSFKCLSLCSVDFQNQFGKLSTKARTTTAVATKATSLWLYD